LTKAESTRLPDHIKNNENHKSDLNWLFNSYHNFKQLADSKLDIDSLKKVFRSINNVHNVFFGNYFYEELLKSNSQKVLIFSTSMSYECKLEMCYKQESEIQKSQKENPNNFNYTVIDAYSNEELTNKYRVSFIPTIILFDSANAETNRFVREEKMVDLNKNILN
jgi:hypothetical protein